MAWVRAAVHVDRPVGVGSTNIEDVDALKFGKLDELHAIRGQELSGDARRLAACMRFQFVLLPIVVYRPGPWLKRHLRYRSNRGGDAEHRQPQALVLGRPAAEERATLAFRGAGLGGAVLRPCRSADAADHALHALWLLLRTQSDCG